MVARSSSGFNRVDEIIVEEMDNCREERKGVLLRSSWMTFEYESYRSVVVHEEVDMSYRVYASERETGYLSAFMEEEFVTRHTCFV